MSAFIDVARRGYNNPVLYVLTVVAVMVAYSAGQLPLTTVLRYYVGRGDISSQTAAEFFDSLDFTLVGIPSWAGLLFLLGSSLMALLALVLCIRVIHRRPVRTAITARKTIDWGRVRFGFILWFVLTILSEMVMYAIDPEVYQFDVNWGGWLPLVIVSILFIPLQSTFEEIFTRGYLLQGVVLATRSRWVAVLVTSVAFATLHLANPEVREFGLPLMLVYYLTVAIFLAVLTIVDDGLEFALGIHAATNIYGAAFVSFKGSVLQTDALVKVSEVGPVEMVLLYYAMMVAFFFIVKQRYNLAPLSTLLLRIETGAPADKEFANEVFPDPDDPLYSPPGERE